MFLEEAGRPGSDVDRFERAADGIVAGDRDVVRALAPPLVATRSMRRHHARLLHYCSANAVEDFRQKTPANIVAITEFLLDAGSEVDATLADGESTTFGLVASSVHPLRAGVQIPLLELLLARGASIDGAPGGHAPVILALANGRGAAAEFLATRGARLDLESAAGVGRLDLVREWFDAAPAAKRTAGLMWASEYGRNAVVAHLLERGVPAGAQDRFGMTALHWAIVGRQPETVRLLLARGAPLDVKNVWGADAHGQARWAAEEVGGDYGSIFEALKGTG